MSQNYNRAKFNKAETGRHQRVLLLNELYPPYNDEGYNWRNGGFPNHKGRSYKTWKYTRKKQYKEIPIA